MRIKNVLIVCSILLLLMVGIGYGSYRMGVRAITKEYESMQVDSTIMKRVDSLFNVILVRLDTSTVGREIIYKNTQTTYQKLIESYEKANSIRPIDNNDSLLQSLTRISNTKF
jgi:hypothetical protein